MQRNLRMKKEIEMLTNSPPPGISCWPINDNVFNLGASINGVDGTPYEKGVFKLEIQIPDRYPFEPPKIKFLTSIYHPNIDSAGRICLDILKMPPKGDWKPSLNISTVLSSILLLMNTPNPDDPLVTEISEEFRFNNDLFNQKAKEWTVKHAIASKRPMELSAAILTETSKKRKS